MKPKIKAVFDTNVYISAILFGGNPRTCLELARAREIELFVSRPILLELAQKLQDKFLWSVIEIEEVIEGLAMFVKVVSPRAQITTIKEEPKDNRILECALEAAADYIISGDKKHLLSLEKFKGIPIISSKDFLGNFYQSS